MHKIEANRRKRAEAEAEHLIGRKIDELSEEWYLWEELVKVLYLLRNRGVSHEKERQDLKKRKEDLLNFLDQRYIWVNYK